MSRKVLRLYRDCGGLEFLTPHAGPFKGWLYVNVKLHFFRHVGRGERQNLFTHAMVVRGQLAEIDNQPSQIEGPFP